MAEERRKELVDMVRLNDDIAEIKSTVKDIFKILNGNGTVGLVTKVALNDSSITRAWYWLSAVSVAIVIAAITFITESVRK